MPKLSWIADSDLALAIASLTTSVQDIINRANNPNRRNVTDPFGALLIASAFKVESKEQLEQLQQSEAGLRGITNPLGYFHQEVLGAVQGWNNHDAGYDLESESQRMLAEVKNKYNTMNASNRQQVLDDLDTAVRQKGAGWSGYLVIILPRRPQRFEERLNTGRPVYEIDGASFYHKVTGDPNAIHDLFDVLSSELTESTEIAEYCREILGSSIPPRL